MKLCFADPGLKATPMAAWCLQTADRQPGEGAAFPDDDPTAENFEGDSHVLPKDGKPH